MITFNDQRQTTNDLPPGLRSSAYSWPIEPFRRDTWTEEAAGLSRTLPERLEDVAVDSRWPAFFPSPISIVTTADGAETGLEKVVGASIVNRFPYIVALSFCRQELSARHHVRARFMELLEKSGVATVQFLAAGEELQRVMAVIADVPDHRTADRIRETGLRVRQSRTQNAPIFEKAYLAYEARLVSPTVDFEGQPIYEKPWADVGSHRVYFLEITAIQLREDIADSSTQILWRSLPAWQPEHASQMRPAALERLNGNGRYAKGYTPNYRFPSAGTIAFERSETVAGMAIKYLPPLPKDQVEVDNDRARWPCFFPSSVGMITSWDESGSANLMPCGSTTILSRHPLIITPCVSYAAINERYAPRKSLDSIRRTGRFGCGVPYVNDDIVAGIRYAGNTSLAQDPDKLQNAGFAVIADDWAPVLPSMPVHFDCAVTGEIRLGTHIMFLGEVRRIRVRRDVSPENPLVWCPWADLAAASA